MSAKSGLSHDIRTGNWQAVKRSLAHILQRASVSEIEKQAQLDDALATACIHGQVDMVRNLLKMGADPNPEISPLSLSTQPPRRWNHQTITEDEEDGVSAERDTTSEANHGEVVVELLKAGVDKAFLLHWGARSDAVEVVRALLQQQQAQHQRRQSQQSFLFSTDPQGHTVLHVAVLFSSVSVLRLLLEMNVLAVDVEDSEGWTALHYACSESKGDFRTVLHLLIKHGADLRRKTPGGKLSLQLAQESGRVHALLAELPTGVILDLLTRVDNVVLSTASLVAKAEKKPASQARATLFRRVTSISSSSPPQVTTAPSSPLNGTSTSWWQESPKEHRDIVVTVWKRILLNDDITMLRVYAHTPEAWRPSDNSKDAIRNSFLPAQSLYLGAEELRELFFSCHENGTGLYSYMESHYATLIQELQFNQLLEHLTQLRDFQAIQARQDDGVITLIDSPECSILLWALLCGRLKTVETLLRMSQFDLLPMALLLVLVLRRLTARERRFPEQVSQALRLFADNVLEVMAVDALNRIFLNDNSPKKWLTRYFLTRPMKVLGGLSLMHLADRAKCTDFLSASCCQTVVEQAWYGGTYYLPWPVRWLLQVCPPLVWAPQLAPHIAATLPSAYESTDADSLEGAGMTKEDSQSGYFHARRPSIGLPPASAPKPPPSMKTPQQPTFQQRLRFIVTLFQSPSVKCFHNLIVHLIFLGIFAEVILNSITFKPELLELLCISFVVGYVLEEVRQMVQHMRHEGTLHFYLVDAWNWIDLGAVVCTLLGFVLRMVAFGQRDVASSMPQSEAEHPLLSTTRVLYILGFLWFSVRILYLLYMFRSMGPKLSMIRSMLQTGLVPMLPIFLICMCAFGVVLQGLLYPNSFTANGNHTQFSRGETFGRLIKLAFYGMFSVDMTVSGQTCTDEMNSVGCHLVVYGAYIIYAVVMTVALLNLLIALYADEVAKVDMASLAHWLAERYDMVKEFRGRSVFPPPFNIIAMVGLLFYLASKWIFRRICFKKSLADSDTSGDGSIEAPRHVRWLIPYFVLQAFVLRAGQRHQLGVRHGVASYQFQNATEKPVKSVYHKSQKLRQITALKEEVERLKKQMLVAEKWIRENFHRLQGAPEIGDQIQADIARQQKTTSHGGRPEGTRQKRVDPSEVSVVVPSSLSSASHRPLSKGDFLHMLESDDSEVA